MKIDAKRVIKEEYVKFSSTEGIYEHTVEYEDGMTSERIDRREYIRLRKQGVKAK